EAGKHQEAADAFARIAKDGTPGYRALARLREAGELPGRDAKAAVAIFEQAGGDASVPTSLRDLAAIRGGYLLLDTAPFGEMQQRLEPLTEQARPFRHSARELLAVSAWRSNDSAAARRWSETIVNDADTPATIRQRVEMLLALLPAQAKG